MRKRTYHNGRRLMEVIEWGTGPWLEIRSMYDADAVSIFLTSIQVKALHRALGEFIEEHKK